MGLIVIQTASATFELHWDSLWAFLKKSTSYKRPGRCHERLRCQSDIFLLLLEAVSFIKTNKQKNNRMMRRKNKQHYEQMIHSLRQFLRLHLHLATLETQNHKTQMKTAMSRQPRTEGERGVVGESVPAARGGGMGLRGDEFGRLCIWRNRGSSLGSASALGRLP